MQERGLTTKRRGKKFNELGRKSRSHLKRLVKRKKMPKLYEKPSCGIKSNRVLSKKIMKEVNLYFKKIAKILPSWHNI